MTRNKKFLLGGVAFAALAAGAVAASAHRGGFGHHGGMGGLMGAVCRGDAAEMADHMLVSIEHKVNPTDAQKGAFEDLKQAARAAAAKAKTACPPAPVKAADGSKPARKTPVERLALMEARLTAELDAVKTVRPAAEKFYASLSDEQKKAFAFHERVERGRGEWGHGDRAGPGRGGEFRHHDWGHGEGGPDGDAPKAPDKPQ